MIKPSFFIVGAPRCGTTALSKYLSQNSYVGFSAPKEPHYFIGIPNLRFTGPKEPQVFEFSTEYFKTHYLSRFFSHCGSECQALGEGSVSYLYSQAAIENILKFNPDSKFIVLLRNPIDMVYSYHARLLFTLDENIEDFSKAWALQGVRAQGKYISKECRDPRLLQYGEGGKLGKYLDKLFQLAGREQCLVVFFQDFIANPEKTYREVLEFINVPYDGRKEFPPVRENKHYKLRWLHQLTKRPPVKIAKQVQGLKEENGEAKNGIPTLTAEKVRKLRKRLIQWNTSKKSRPPLTPEMKEVLIDAFAEDVEKLSSLLERDFSEWMST